MKTNLQIRLVVYVTLFSILLTGVVSIFQIQKRYVQGVADIKHVVEQTSITHEGTFANNLWRFDEPSIEMQMKSIVSSPPIVFIEVIDDRGTIRNSGDTSHIVDELTHRRAITFAENDTTIVLGSMVLYSTDSALRSSLIRDIPTIVVTELLKTFSIALFLVVLFYMLFGRHLATIIAYAETFYVGDDVLPLTLQRKSVPGRRDELDRLSSAINRMTQRMCDDFSHRREIEVELRQREENVRVTLASIGDAVVATDKYGKITRMNPVAEELSGHRFTDVAGCGFAEVFRLVDVTSKEPIENPVQRVIQTKAVTGIERNTLIISQTGKEYHIGDSAAPIFTSSNELLGVVVVFHDITEEILMQEKLNQSQKMDALGQLSGGIAHDFNNILGGILGAAELIEDDSLSQEEKSEFIQMIKTTADRGAGLTRKLLSFSRKGSIEQKGVSIHLLIHETEAILSRTIDKKIDIKIDLQVDERCTILGDETLLENALLNLGINASHAMPEGGTLTFTAQMKSLDSTYCEQSTFNLTSGEFVELSVHDTGCGMTPEVQKKIFEPFYTTKSQGKGTGLGLASVYGTVQDHSGAISVYSEVGVGTVFHLYFPVISETHRITYTEDTIEGGTETILVVDDDDIMRHTAKAMLEYLGYTVYASSDGKSGIELFQKQGGEIDAVLLDMIMPVMSGKDVFTAIRAISPEIPIVVASGFSQEDVIKNMQEQGLSGVISKPFNRGELSRVIRSLFAK